MRTKRTNIDAFPNRSRRGRRWLIAAILGTLLAITYAAWPRVTLWQLDRALVENDRARITELVDLDLIRQSIRNRLNKESQTDIGPVSDRFIQWLEQAIRRDGTQALEQQIDLDWVRDRLLLHSPPGTGLADALTDAGFDDPFHFVLRLGAEDDQPVYATLSYQGTGWRLTALRF